MKEVYVDFEQACALRKFGFPTCTRTYYSSVDRHLRGTNEIELLLILDDVKIPAPTLYLAQKFLREEKNLHVLPVLVETEKDYLYSVHVIYKNDFNLPPDKVKHYYINTEGTYDDAINDGINKCIEILKAT